MSSSELTTQERLLVAQAVHEVGAGDWTKVSGLLDPHPLCTTRPAGYWSAQDAYTELMTENKLELPAEPISKPKAKEHLKLARIYYFARVAELRAAIFEGIEDFKRIAGEIKEIKAGRWDDKLQPATAGQRTRDSTRSDAEIAAELVPPTPLDEQPPTEDAESAAEEADAPKIKSTPASRRKGRRGRPSEDLEELHVKPEEEDEPVASTSAGSPVRPSVEPSEDAGDEPTSARRGGRRSNPKSRKRKRTESVEPGSAARPSASPEVELKRPRISESVAEDDEDPEERRARDLRFRKSMQLVHDQIMSDGRSTFFRAPVRRSDAPAYHDAIKRPMDLKTVGTRLRQGIITSTAAYRRDVMNIFANAIMFNNPTTGRELVKQAVEMAEVAEEAITAYESIEARQNE